MFQISAVLSALTTEQREAIAAFIVKFPRNINEKAVIIPSFTVSDEDEEQSPETVFSAVTSTHAAPVLMVPTVIHDSGTSSTITSTLDKNGIPWDERIHASSRVKIADGSWRTKRGVDETLVAQVTNELKALMGIPAPPVAAVIPAPPAPIADTPAAVVAAVPPPPPVAPVERSAFVALIGKASALIGAKKLTQEELTSAVVAAGVPSLPLLANRLDLVPFVTDTIDAMVAAR
jgi:hypothetical protein